MKTSQPVPNPSWNRNWTSIKSQRFVYRGTDVQIIELTLLKSWRSLWKRRVLTRVAIISTFKYHDLASLLQNHNDPSRQIEPNCHRQPKVKTRRGRRKIASELFCVEKRAVALSSAAHWSKGCLSFNLIQLKNKTKWVTDANSRDIKTEIYHNCRRDLSSSIWIEKWTWEY